MQVNQEAESELSASADGVSHTLAQSLRSLRGPGPLLDRERERALTQRQREVLDQLQVLVESTGFAGWTMSRLAARLCCSLRELYAVAPSRDELVLIAVDRNLWRVGRSALLAIDGCERPLDALMVYLRAANEGVRGWTVSFVRDLLEVPAALELERGHNQYLRDMTKVLLDLAVTRGEIEPINTAALSHLVAGLGRYYSRPDVLAALGGSATSAADDMVDIVLRGLPETSERSEDMSPISESETV